jgi:hypothetical protein
MIYFSDSPDGASYQEVVGTLLTGPCDYLRTLEVLLAVRRYNPSHFGVIVGGADHCTVLRSPIKPTDIFMPVEIQPHWGEAGFADLILNRPWQSCYPSIGRECAAEGRSGSNGLLMNLLGVHEEVDGLVDVIFTLAEVGYTPEKIASRFGSLFPMCRFNDHDVVCGLNLFGLSLKGGFNIEIPGPSGRQNIERVAAKLKALQVIPAPLEGCAA